MNNSISYVMKAKKGGCDDRKKHFGIMKAILIVFYWFEIFIEYKLCCNFSATIISANVYKGSKHGKTHVRQYVNFTFF